MANVVDVTDENANYWNSRWKNNETGWDVGYPSPAITSFFEKVEDKSVPILIPGCGNAYEAGYLADAGFTDITVIDISSSLVEKLRNRFESQPQIKVVCGDFFEHTGCYHIIIEQTFFCAIDPSLRSAYVRKCHQLLAPNGAIVGLLFDKIFEKQGPPFGGSAGEYRGLFEPYFNLDILSPAYNSIEPRKGTEVFIKFTKK